MLVSFTELLGTSDSNNGIVCDRSPGFRENEGDLLQMEGVAGKGMCKLNHRCFLVQCSSKHPSIIFFAVLGSSGVPLSSERSKVQSHGQLILGCAL
jgi:hypothetical protein